MQDSKQDLYKKSNELKNGWKQYDTEMPDEGREKKMEAVVKAEEKKSSVIVAPPVVTLPAEVGYGEKPLAMAYVKMQKWEETYEPDLGLERGTIFPELDLPFVGEGACLYE